QEMTAYGGRQCAHIRLTGELQLAIADLPAPATAQITGDVYHDLGLQRPVAVEFSGPLTVNGQTQQDGRRITLTGEGRREAKESSRGQRGAGKPGPAPQASEKPAAKPDAPAPPGAVRYGALGLHMPGPDWKVIQWEEPDARGACRRLF